MVSIQSANRFVLIESNIDYTNRESFPKQISILHCIRTNKESIIIKPTNGSSLKFPSNSFISGAIYPISIENIDYGDQEPCFVGYINY